MHRQVPRPRLVGTALLDYVRQFMRQQASPCPCWWGILTRPEHRVLQVVLHKPAAKAPGTEAPDNDGHRRSRHRRCNTGPGSGDRRDGTKVR